ncbi:hypothetical protein [Acinetobacter sp. NS-4]|uniref:hypothetical protein n=1 Tax=Acinetobacter sp. NS-4 TaxID=3127956 RepID=UPI00307FB29C
MNPLERINKSVFGYEKEFGCTPDIIYLTRQFFEAILRDRSIGCILPMNDEHPEIFGMKVFVIPHLDGLDFSLFSAWHLNRLSDKYKKDSRYSDYTIEIVVPRYSSTEVSCVANGSAAPTINDQAALKNIKVTASANILKDWVKQK